MASKVPQTVNQPPAVQPTPAPRPGGSASALPARLPPAVRLVAPEPAQGEDVAPGTLDLKTMGSSFAPPEAIASFLDARQTSRVNVRLGKLAAGTLSVETLRKGKYQVKQQPIPLAHPLFLGANPALFLRTEGQQLKGQIGFVSGTKLDALSPDDLKKAPELLGLTGFRLERFPTFVNTLEAGQLRFGIKGVALTLGSVFVGKLDLEAVDETVTFAASAEVDTKGLAKGSLQLNRAPDGQISGKVSVGLAFSKGGKNLSGSVEVTWDGNAVGGEGKLGYSGEKLSGSITVHLMEKTQAQRLEQEKKAPSAEGAAQKPAPPKTPGRKLDYVVFGEGDLTFAFNDWLHGTAHVILDPFGFVTIIGKITPQKEFPLFDPKDYNKHLFKLEARATYGLPVVGNIFIFANVGLEAFAKMQGKFYNIIAQGTYSTDPQKAKDFSIQGSLNISAVAGLTLRAEAGVGVEILSHDIKAGAGINGTAGIRGYAEATPIIGYREPASEGQDKKGEWFIRGEIEIAAQPFLGLSGDLFVELSTPWWSPLSDDRWTWPLFNKEWPIGGSYGVGATLDYVFGSGQWPKLDFKPVEFSSEKFTSDMFDKKGQPGMGWREQKGKWQEKNNAAAQPPPKVSPPGNAKPGKALTPTPAKPKVGRGTRKSTRAADPNAKTVSGKTVKQYQDEAAKKGKQPPGAPKDEAAKKEKQAHDEELKKGLAALDAVTKGYAKKGATKEELVTALKAVRRKFKVFKSIEVVPDGKKWKYHYVASQGDQPGPPMVQFGTKENPYQIKWHKRATANFDSFTLQDVSVKPDGRLSVGFVVVKPTSQQEITVDKTPEIQRKIKTTEGYIQNIEQSLADLRQKLATSPHTSLTPQERTTALSEAQEAAEEAKTKLAELRKTVKKGEKVDEARQALSKARDYADEIQRTSNRIARIPSLEQALALHRVRIQELHTQLTVPKDFLRTEVIGVAPANQIKMDRKLGPRVQRAKSERKMQKPFREFMFAAGLDMSAKNLEAEHVSEFSMSGPDRFDNLWPLPATENITPDQIINRETGKEIGVGLEGAGDKGELINNASFVKESAWVIVKGFKK